LAERAVALAPTSGDAWLALAYAHLYTGAAAEATRALIRAVSTAPGFAVAQNLLGELLLEAGDLAHAIPHLEAAISLDPSLAQLSPLARAYIYDDRYDQAMAVLAADPPTILREITIGRFKMWRGERYEARSTSFDGLRPEL